MTEQERAEQYLVDKARQEETRRARHALLAAPPENAVGLWMRTKALWGRWPSSTRQDPC